MKVYIIIVAFFICEVTFAQKVWSFNDCLSYARENNLQVIASKLNEQVQETSYKISKKQKLPDLTGTVGNDFTFGPTTKQSIDLQELKINSYYKYTEGYQNSLALQSSILLYNNGNLKMTEEKNNLLVKQYQLTTEKIKNDVSLQLVGNYLTVLLNKELMIVEKNSMDTYFQQYDRNEKMYNAGSIPLSTLYESKASLANAKQSHENALIEVDRSLMILAMLLQKDYRDFQIEDVKVSDDIGAPLVNVEDIVQYAYSNQPEIKSVEVGIEAAKKDVEIAKTALYPTITGGYKASTAYQDFFDRPSKSLNDQWYDNHIQMLSVGVSIPIFNKGISKLQIEQSKIQQTIQENQLDQEKLTLKQNIETAYFDVNSSYQTFLSAKESVASNKISYEFAQKSFTAGKINAYDLNTARNNYFSAQSQMLQAKYSFLFRLKILDFYTGKPLEITSDENISNYNYGNINQNINSISPENRVIAQPNTNSDQVQDTEVKTETTNNTIIPPSTTETNSASKPQPENMNKTVSVTDSTAATNVKKEELAKEEAPATVTTNTVISENPSILVPETKKEEKLPVAETKESSLPEIQKPEDKKVEPPVKATETKKTENQAELDEKTKREALIMERRAQLSKGSSNTDYQNNSQREALIKERRARLSKGLD